ncbi:MAG: Gfo/Idh/MocA family oxidoreductase [Polaromonas sp.]|uniref:Gfo/Idh/MocA family protein n=1 Tax=Polaromonas sp. TaxID=1869339 RepID=UPI0025F08FF6|nr:Gfo/Idh/MocA family oxidoreductase [Polaromonas sp.]MBI2729042.1 Gfo/Idh/MocA family oxidoreductase [Polaromonas sp.]
MSTKAGKIKIGVAGLGRAFTLMLPTFVGDRRVSLTGATDPIAAARTQFEKDFAAPTFDSLEAMCASPDIDVVYIASPHQFHADHACIAASHGKHILVEKPMALSIDECTRMIEAARKAGVHLIVGHSHSFNTPIKRTRELIDSGAYGKVRMITAMNFTDFLFRPRRPEELDTQAGGGVIHSQATHQIDIVRLLAGGMTTSVQAHTGAWDATRPTEGAYSALLGFENGAFATAVYSGYGHYDSDELMGNIGEMGQAKSARDYGAARKRLQTAQTAGDEARLKAARNYGGSLYAGQSAQPDTPLAHQHFGHLVVSCEKADLRPTPSGIDIFADDQRSFEALPQPAVPRSEVMDELYAAVIEGKPPLHSGEWARATTEVCLAILASARGEALIRLHHQVALPGHENRNT